MSSWIFLMISALLIVSGLFLCNYARSKAPDDEVIDGYTSGDNQSYTELDYSDERVSTLSLALSDCKVELRGGSDEAKVELIGFKPNSYIGTVTAKTIRISNQLSLLDYFSFDGSGVSFAGVWRTLLSFAGEQADEDPQVIIYIPEDNDIKQYNLTFDNCVVSMVDLLGESEYSMVATNSTLEINTLGASMMDMTCDDSEISVVNATVDHLTYEQNGGNLVARELAATNVVFTGDEGDINLIDAGFINLELKMEKCDLNLASVYTQGSYLREIRVEKGEVYLGELLLGSEDLSPEGESAPGKLTIELESGNIVTKYGDSKLVLEEESPETVEPSTSENTQN